MKDFTTDAIVLREVNYKEADKVLTLLTPDQGKLTVTARGCRRKNSKIAAATQLLVLSEMTLYQFQNRWAIREANTRQLFWTVRGDIVRLSLASYFAELTELVAQEELPSGELLQLLLNSLYALDQLDKPLNQVKSAFEWKLMSLSGFAPLLEGCAVCGAEPSEPMFHLREGVLHCRACRSRMGEGAALPLTPSAVAALRHITQGNPKRLLSFRLEEESQRLLDRAGEAFVLAQLERGFHTLDFYRKL